MASKKKGDSNNKNNQNSNSGNKKGGGEENRPDAAQIFPCEISSEMKDSYLDYAMSVITSRALPDIRDGMKPVHRRILYTLHQMGLTHMAKFRKSAAIIGNVMGRFHPHGDAAIYDALAKMAQSFNYRYPLIIGQGNFGSIDGDSPAAMRYTEAKMASISSEMLKDLEKETVEWRSNYDGTRQEPELLPAALPNVLLNGILGIAVGMATRIPPHNLKEVANALIHLIDNPSATTEDLLEYIQGPDFPTGGIIFNKSDIYHAYAHGTGGVVVRGEAEIVEQKGGNFQIVISSLPYRVNKADLIMKIADMVKNRKIEGIKDLKDESTKDIRIVVSLKPSAQPQNVLNYLYKHTQLEDIFHFNMVGLLDGVPQGFSLKSILENFVEHRRLMVKRRTEYELKKAQDREHILLGLKKALDNIDAIIKLIKSAKDAPTAHANLMKKYNLSDRQATAILEMKLQKLAGLERQKIEQELKDIQDLIKRLQAILKSKKKILNIIKDELNKAVEQHGDERRTKVVSHEVKTITPEDLVPDEESVMVLTEGGYIKRTRPDEYKKQKRGGVGVVDLNTKEEDFVTKMLTTSTHNNLLFFTDKGKAYQLKMYEIPEGKRSTKGKSIMNFLSLNADEKVTSVLAIPKEFSKEISLMMFTRDGWVKRVSPENFREVRKSGLIAINLVQDDKLINARFAERGSDTLMMTAKGQAIRFKVSDVRQMGRTAAGVRGIKLSKEDYVIGADIVQKGADKKCEAIVLTTVGYGKRTYVGNYKVQKRGGSGIKTAKLTNKTGDLIAMRVIGSEEELVVISQKGQVIRTDIKEIPTLGRQAQGVKVMKLRAGDSIAALICL